MKTKDEKNELMDAVIIEYQDDLYTLCGQGKKPMIFYAALCKIKDSLDEELRKIIADEKESI